MLHGLHGLFQSKHTQQQQQIENNVNFDYIHLSIIHMEVFAVLHCIHGQRNSSSGDIVTKQRIVQYFRGEQSAQACAVCLYVCGIFLIIYFFHKPKALLRSRIGEYIRNV